MLFNLVSRVENWRSGYRLKFVFSVSHPFVYECHNISAIPYFQLPLVEPCLRFSLTRLSDNPSSSSSSPGNSADVIQSEDWNNDTSFPAYS